MILDKLIGQIRQKKSFLCVGLDPDLEKMPTHLLESDDPIFAFNKAIIDATHPFAVAYKPNLAFYEVLGVSGWNSLKKTINYLNENYPDIFTIADAKRGDIGNTARMYAHTFFDTFGFDAVTVAPYMGRDSVEPFLQFENKYTILLGLTSNPGADDFQKPDLYKKVMRKSQQWQHAERLMYVVGATQAEALTEIRKILPEAFLLIPGVGTQGGSLQDVCRYGLNSDVGLLINASRSILYASNRLDFAEKAAEEAAKLQAEMGAFVG
ncbi:MAG: orotidine-5'-phosphate decarboxylase [Flavobacteriaceae bacterium]|nr:orotidine-5'-phosphate decarboxylase [Flavobacteriaceae bacterium]